MYEWAKLNPKFKVVLERLNDRQAEQLINNGLAGTYNSTIAKMLLSAKHGIHERTEVDNTLTFDPENKTDKYLGQD